jgi:hypothetical protein
MKRARQHRSLVRLVIDQKTLNAIHAFIGKHPAERGGILGADSDGVIRHFVADSNARCTAAAYDPDIEAMNRQIKAWKVAVIVFKGFVHSHPPDYRELSLADKDYAARILDAFKNLDWLALPLVMTEPDCGQFEVLLFVGVPDLQDRSLVRFQEATLAVEGEQEQTPDTGKRTASNRARKRTPPRPSVSTITTPTSLSPGADTAGASIALTQPPPDDQPVDIRYQGDFLSWWRLTASCLRGQQSLTAIIHEFSLEERLEELKALERARTVAARYFERVETAYDQAVVDGTRLLFLGDGGSAGLIRACARARFGEFVLFDKDVISASNVATQSVDPTKIGVSKVDALAEDIRAYNPAAAVVAVHGKIEGISDRDFEALATGPLRGALQGSQGRSVSALSALNYPARPEKVILLVLTDNFEAQARGHRLGLQFGLPTICAQEYHEGRGAEITFTVPGVTPACHRCITASRYRAYLSEGYHNTVTSHGAPIFAAEMLNAALGHILLGVAHHGTNHPRFGDIVIQGATATGVRMWQHLEAESRPMVHLRRPHNFRRHDGRRDRFSRRKDGE